MLKMGGSNSKYLSELSDDSSDDNESCYTIEYKKPEKLEAYASDINTHITLAATNMLCTNMMNNISDTPEAVRCKNKEVDLTTDAALNSKNFPKPEAVLTLAGVLEIEKDLDEYEMVSLVYLLYDEAYVALQELIMWLNGAQKNLLYSWASHAKSSGVEWQNKLIESLCVIKNYEILRKLGYDKYDLIAHYLPQRVNTITSLRRLKKAAYIISESLDAEKTSKFLEQVRFTFQQKKLEFDEYSMKYLELYFLKWETMKYINVSDFGFIKTILKEMNEEFLHTMLDSAVTDQQKVNVKNVSPEKCNQQVEGKVPKSNQPSTSIDTHLRLPDIYNQQEFASLPLSNPCLGQDNPNSALNFNVCDHRYFIDPKNPGIILIINEEDFYTEFEEKHKHLLPEDTEYKLESRKGTEKDRNDLENIFKKFGFKVIIKNNLTHIDLLNTIKDVVNSIKDESSLFVCILSHGDKGIVYGSNSCRVKVSKIQEIMCKTNKANLTEKPKVLILQSCQGKQCQKIDESSEEDYEDYSMTTDGPGSNKQSVPRTADMLTFWATVPGYAAIRSKRTGSWFIQALCQKMREIGNRHHLADICTRIVNDVTSMKWTVQENDKNAMTPMVVSTLRKDFYLPPMREEY